MTGHVSTSMPRKAIDYSSIMTLMASSSFPKSLTPKTSSIYPNLRKLELTGSVPGGILSSVSKRVTRLSKHRSAQSASPDKDTPKLRILDAGWSPIAEPVEVATLLSHFLSRAHPRIQEEDPTPPAFEPKWAMLHDLLPPFARARILAFLDSSIDHIRLDGWRSHRSDTPGSPFLSKLGPTLLATQFPSARTRVKGSGFTSTSAGEKVKADFI
ncbi:hypothetical protein EYR38_004924 [Pleurotus pulmonarius]|nr:hypothetical protein EYR38_004924 [Pleurotus pulmonarius]